MNRLDYEVYRARVAAFFEREGVNCLTTDSEDENGDPIGPYFSWRPCDCCQRHWGGNRQDCSGYNPTTNEVQSGYSVCDDCVYFVEYGRLDDTTMMSLEEGE